MKLLPRQPHFVSGFSELNVTTGVIIHVFRFWLYSQQFKFLKCPRLVVQGVRLGVDSMDMGGDQICGTLVQASSCYWTR